MLIEQPLAELAKRFREAATALGLCPEVASCKDVSRVGRSLEVARVTAKYPF